MQNAQPAATATKLVVEAEPNVTTKPVVEASSDDEDDETSSDDDDEATPRPLDVADMGSRGLDGDRQYENLMSGDWAFRQAVHLYL